MLHLIGGSQSPDGMHGIYHVFREACSAVPPTGTVVDSHCTAPIGTHLQLLGVFKHWNSVSN